MGALTSISEQGLKVLDDISVVGFNDIRLAAKIFTPLTTIRFPLYDMGYTASKVLINKIQKKPVKNER